MKPAPLQISAPGFLSSSPPFFSRGTSPPFFFSPNRKISPVCCSKWLKLWVYPNIFPPLYLSLSLTLQLLLFYSPSLSSLCTSHSVLAVMTVSLKQCDLCSMFSAVLLFLYRVSSLSSWRDCMHDWNCFKLVEHPSRDQTSEQLMSLQYIYPVYIWDSWVRLCLRFLPVQREFFSLHSRRVLRATVILGELWFGFRFFVLCICGFVNSWYIVLFFELLFSPLRCVLLTELVQRVIGTEGFRSSRLRNVSQLLLSKGSELVGRHKWQESNYLCYPECIVSRCMCRPVPF